MKFWLKTNSSWKIFGEWVCPICLPFSLFLFVSWLRRICGSTSRSSTWFHPTGGKFSSPPYVLILFFTLNSIESKYTKQNPDLKIFLSNHKLHDLTLLNILKRQIHNRIRAEKGNHNLLTSDVSYYYIEFLDILLDFLNLFRGNA